MEANKSKYNGIRSILNFICLQGKMGIHFLTAGPFLSLYVAAEHSNIPSSIDF